MSEVVALLVVASAFAGAILFHARESAAWRVERASLIDSAKAERADLLSRIMSRTYTDFVYAQKPADAEDVPQMLTDTDEAKWYAEHRPKADNPNLDRLDAEWHRQNFAEHPDQYPDGLPEGVAA